MESNKNLINDFYFHIGFLKSLLKKKELKDELQKNGINEVFIRNMIDVLDAASVNKAK